MVSIAMEKLLVPPLFKARVRVTLGEENVPK